MPSGLPTNILTVRQTAIQRLRSLSPSPALDVDMLLAELLGVDRAYLLAHGDQSLTDQQHEQFAAWLERAASGEPIAYILGKRGFYDLELIVTSDVLIPRPETELLLEQAIAWAKDKASSDTSPRFASLNSPSPSYGEGAGGVRLTSEESQTVKPQIAAVDVGTGSGALAVTFAKHMPQAQVYATDVSPAALEVARRNAERHNTNVTFLQGALLSPLIEQNIRVDLVMANLPYIASDEVPTLAVSRHEPLLALDGGSDGLDLIRRLLSQIPRVCNPNALILLEIGAAQGVATLELVQQTLNPHNAEVLQDYAGLDRIVRVVIG